MGWYAALFLWYGRKRVALLPFSESCTCESVPSTSNSADSQQPLALFVLKAHPQKSGTSQNFHYHTVIITFDFSHFTFNFHSTFTCLISQDMVALNLCLFPHHSSTSTAFCSIPALPVVPVKHRHGLLAVKYRMFQICVSNCIEGIALY